jgi:alpha-glucosidase
VAKRSFDDTWEQPWGERRYVRNHWQRDARGAAREVRPAAQIVFQVFDDGVGFRYEFPTSRCSSR